ncbi:diguanylate cyclase [Leeia sp.]|uniref:diguanylate cyclase n=1 Tax=Leeia sp. TaxID=2884678 RepID=UPI0035AE52F1
MADSPVPDDFAAVLAELKANYLQELPDKLLQVEQGLQQAFLAGASDDDYATLVRIVHSLAGSAGSFGLPELSKVAKAMELALRAQTPAALAQSPAIQSDLIQQFALMRSQCVAADSKPVSNRLQPAVRRASAAVAAYGNRVLLVEDEVDTAELHATQIRFFNYEVMVLHDHTRLRETLDSLGDVAIILMDMSFPDHPLGGAEALMTLQGSDHETLPVLFLSSRDDFESRLHAARAGGNGYLLKPVEIANLVEAMDRQLNRVRPEPERILIVDDDLAVSHLYARALQQEGMVVQTVSEASHIEAALAELHPDLVLLDLYMPVWSGMEIAAAIRQHPAYVSLPIVFLSSEEDVSRQLSAMRQGADEFLTKPIQLPHLIESVRTRVERYRALRGYMLNDSLTGVLNHAAIMNRLDVELARAIRTQSPLSIVMLDLDHFKRVNDDYGHPVGDRVLKSLTYMLRQRLRSSDSVGRYGGEEFILVMPDTPQDAAVKVMGQLCEAFASLQQYANERAFQVSFSAGVANFPTLVHAVDLISAADQALYLAKQSGRRQVQRYTKPS